jgi:fibronectin type 3 domain-containing protein
MASASAGTSANVTVTWSKPTSWAPASYTLWRKRSGSDPWPATPLAADLTASTFSFVDTTGEAGAVYVYAVTGKSAQFNSSSDRGVTATGYPRVLPPTAVVASDGNYPGYVQVSWTPTGTSTGVSWEVWRRRAGTTEAYTKIRTVTQPVVLDTTALVGVTYQYYVTTRASNGVTSAASATDNGFR